MIIAFVHLISLSIGDDAISDNECMSEIRDDREWYG